ncbi:hypothetical protein Aperf_G00000083032 [Anoplocephala perfoliata]
MDNLLSTIRKAGDNGSAVVSALEANEDILVKSLSVLGHFADRCETDFWTLAKLTAYSTVDSQFCTEIQTFFEAANPDHLQLTKRTVRKIGNLLTKKLVAQSSAIRGIPILRVAINQMQKNSKYLTSLHVNICQLALYAKNFSPVIAILNEDILDVDPDKRAFCTKDIMLFFYYGGMIYAAVKMWERSCNFLTLACTIPTSSMSTIAFSAAKKLIVVSLIHKGEFNWSDCPVFRRIKDQTEAYKSLEVAFMSSNTSDLQAVIEENKSVYVADNNFGLVKQLVDCHMKYRIQNLTRSFISLSMNDFVSMAHLESADAAELKLVEMAASKSIFVKIDQKSGCIRFLANPKSYESPEVLSKLIQKMKDTMAFDKVLRRINAEEDAKLANLDSPVKSSDTCGLWPQFKKEISSPKIHHINVNTKQIMELGFSA